MKLPRISKSIVLGAALVGAVSLGACDSNSYPLGVVPANLGLSTDVASLQVFPQVVNIDSIGQTVQLVASARDASGQPIPDATIDWSSSDLGIVIVSGDGLLTAQGEGRATVVASSGAVETEVPVTVGIAEPFSGTP